MFCELCGIRFRYPDGANPFGWWRGIPGLHSFVW
jgi:hypothetical protein